LPGTFTRKTFRWARHLLAIIHRQGLVTIHPQVLTHLLELTHRQEVLIHLRVTPCQEEATTHLQRGHRASTPLLEGLVCQARRVKQLLELLGQIITDLKATMRKLRLSVTNLIDVDN